MDPEETEVLDYSRLPLRYLEWKYPPYVRTIHPHWHSRLEILHIDEGSMLCRVGSEQIVAAAGDILCIPPRCPHEAYTQSQPVRFRVVMFELSRMEDALPATTRFLRPLLGDTVRLERRIRDAAVTEEIDRITEECRRDDPSALILEGQLYRVLGYLFRYHTDTSYAPRATDLRFRAAVDYVEQHATEPLSAAGLAKMFHYNEAYFCRRFRRQTGLTLTAYCHILRLNQASRLLRDTVLPVEEISHRCGYEGASYFIRCFRQQFGMTPLQWRNQAGKPAIVST